jgi:hypothetical protein
MNILIKSTPIFTDEILNAEVYNKVKELYEATVLKRIKRSAVALNEWMIDFPNQPLPFNTSLQNQITMMENTPNLNNKAMETLQQLKNQLQSGQYCDGTNEHAIYRGSYEDRRLAFVWPTEEEAALRQQEESDLLAQINK